MTLYVPVATASVAAVVVRHILMRCFDVRDDVTEQLPLVGQSGPEVAPTQHHGFFRFAGDGDVEHLLIASGFIAVGPRRDVRLCVLEFGHAGRAARVDEFLDQVQTEFRIEMEENLLLDRQILRLGPQLMQVLVVLDDQRVTRKRIGSICVSLDRNGRVLLVVKILVAAVGIPFSCNLPEIFEETQREQRERARDFENATDLFDAVQAPLQLLDDVVTAFDLHFQVAVDGRAPAQFLRSFDVVDESCLAVPWARSLIEKNWRKRWSKNNSSKSLDKLDLPWQATQVEYEKVSLSFFFSSRELGGHSYATWR